MKELRVFTVLDASLPMSTAPHWESNRQVRLWIVAANKRQAVSLLHQSDIWWSEEAMAGPVRPGVFLNTMRDIGLLADPSVLAYPVPWTADTPVVRVSSKTRLDLFARMGDIVPGQ